MVILGIDEVGRGSWAGPLVVGAVILLNPIKGLKDSKLLTKAQRQLLQKKIINNSIYGLGWVWPKEIDSLGLTKATCLGIDRAIKSISETSYDQIVIDGHINYLPNNPKAVNLIKADNLVPGVSAASILAKVSRDEYMIKSSKKYLNYGFDKHVGYGTALHKLNLIKYGACDLHRLSYKPIKQVLA